MPSATLTLFSLGLFTGAALLFWVQPMFAKMILPLLGGAASVWNTSMVFFQAVLLAGYLWAHLTASRLGARKQAALHAVLVIIVLATLPPAPARGWTPPASDNPAAWLLLLLLVSLGPPAFMLSCTAPMLQKWFTHVGHGSSRDPYFLYAASNLGSVVALLAYPTLIEPFQGLQRQSLAWSGGYFLLVVLVAACALLILRAPGGVESAATAPDPGNHPPPSPPLLRKLRWLLLAFAPSSLLLGVTTLITTDFAPVPLLWVIPLAVYLFTFVLVFSRRPLLRRSWMISAQPPVVLAVIVAWYLLPGGALLNIPMHLVLFFITAMVCHGRLAADRPDPAHLTGYYLWISAGGVLGGLFNALAAPLVFSGVMEYPLAIVLACMLRPASGKGTDSRRDCLFDLLLPALLAAVWVGLAKLLRLWIPKTPEDYWALGLLASAGLVCWSFYRRPLRFGLGVGALMLAGAAAAAGPYTLLHRERNFYGILWVDRNPQLGLITLTHGTTLHGAQSLDPALRGEPQAFYARSSPIGEIFNGLESRLRGGKIAVAGLGAGILAAYGQEGQEMTFYEINPAVQRIARRYFTYLDDSRARVSVVLGDARLKLEEAPDHAYSLIILDVFNSDAIPVHLLTRQALALYLRKLAPAGAIAVHITNRYLDLEPVVAALARDAGLFCLVRKYSGTPPLTGDILRFPTAWTILARDSSGLGGVPAMAGWREAKFPPGERTWTDDYSDIFNVLMR